MAAELRKAADQPLTPHLHKEIHRWETGRHKPSERYMLLYAKVFPGEPAVDPCAALDKARQVPSGIGALEAAAARSGRPELIAMAATIRDLEQQVTAARQHLERLLGEEPS